MKRIIIVSAILLVVPLVAFATPVPDTGQTKCYDNTQEITCPSPGEPFYGQDAQYGINLQSYTKLDVNGNDLPVEATEWVMVRDNVTGLIWEVKTDDGSIHDKDTRYNWDNAQGVFIDELNTNSFGGYNDWRLPTVKELSSIVDSSIPSYPDPTINADYFPNTVSPDYWPYYWSSTTDAALINERAWYVYFYYGYVTYSSRSDNLYVRAVRGEQLSNTLIDNGDGTVTDYNSGLMWQQETAPGTYTWGDAFSYCESLQLADYDDWRLPNVRELQSLVDYNHHNPSIDTNYFSNTVLSEYFSSTTFADSTYSAWYVIFSNGNIDSQDKSGGYYVRAVREAQCGFSDLDEDGIFDGCDNCPDIPNGPELGTCVNTINGGLGATCMNDGECNTGETCNNNQEDTDNDGSGDACDSNMMCKGNFDFDKDVDGTDASLFKAHFGRSTFKNPCPPDGPAPVEKTHQTTSYATGDDGDHQSGVPFPEPRFVDNEDGTVMDNLTGLIWLKNANCFGTSTWEQALLDCDGLANGSCGLTDGSQAGDWRLPNYKELISLIDVEEYNPALPSGHPFTNVRPGLYLSSSTFISYVGEAWGMHMSYGYVDGVSKLVSLYVWPVRGGH